MGLDPPTPLFCVSAGIIGVTGEWTVCAGMIGVTGERVPFAKTALVKSAGMIGFSGERQFAVISLQFTVSGAFLVQVAVPGSRTSAEQDLTGRSSEMERLVMSTESPWKLGASGAGGLTPHFLVSIGNKGLTGEWLASRGRIGLSSREGEEKARMRRKSGRRFGPGRILRGVRGLMPTVHNQLYHGAFTNTIDISIGMFSKLVLEIKRISDISHQTIRKQWPDLLTEFKTVPLARRTPRAHPPNPRVGHPNLSGRLNPGRPPETVFLARTGQLETSLAAAA
jgi:hypothetical protein